MAKKSKKLKILFMFGMIFIITILFFLGIYQNIQKEKLYSLTNKTYYEVTLNPNDYFDNNSLKDHHYYIAKAIKSIDLYFDYALKNQTENQIQYSYDITATIKSYADNGTKLIWTKDFSLKNSDYFKEKDVQINENYQLDYQYYVDYVKTFQEYYHIKTENYLYVNLDVTVQDKDYASILFTIPLNENVVEITMKEENTFLKNQKQNIDLKKIAVFILFVIITGYLGKRILYNKDKEKTILKEYQDIIINIQNEPNMDMNHIIYLTSLKDLIYIAINHHVNIFHYQNNYYVIIDNMYYIYIFQKVQ